MHILMVLKNAHFNISPSCGLMVLASELDNKSLTNGMVSILFDEHGVSHRRIGLIHAHGEFTQGSKDWHRVAG
jgi:hypothetical protein